MFVDASDECNTVMFSTGSAGAARAWDIKGKQDEIRDVLNCLNNQFSVSVTQFKCGDDAGGMTEKKFLWN